MGGVDRDAAVGFAEMRVESVFRTDTPGGEEGGC